jgi:hypothetical protein
VRGRWRPGSGGRKLIESVQNCTDAGRERAQPAAGGAGQLESCMNDAQRYRMNTAECIFAGARCGPAYRDLTFALAESWLSLARQQEAMDELLVIWSNAGSATSAAPSRQSFQYLRELHQLPLAASALR